MAVIGQKGFHTAVSDQLAAQRPGVEQLPVGVAMALHLLILIERGARGEDPLSGRFVQQSPGPRRRAGRSHPRGRRRETGAGAEPAIIQVVLVASVVKTAGAVIAIFAAFVGALAAFVGALATPVRGIKGVFALVWSYRDRKERHRQHAETETKRDPAGPKIKTFTEAEARAEIEARSRAASEGPGFSVGPTTWHGPAYRRTGISWVWILVALFIVGVVLYLLG